MNNVKIKDITLDDHSFPPVKPESGVAELVIYCNDDQLASWGEIPREVSYSKHDKGLYNPRVHYSLDHNQLKAPAVEVKTFVFGQDAKNVTSESIYASILSLETQIDALNKISSKPDSLVAKIKALQTDIKALVAFENARTPEVAKATITIIE